MGYIRGYEEYMVNYGDVFKFVEGNYMELWAIYGDVFLGNMLSHSTDGTP